MKVIAVVLSGGASRRFQIEGEGWVDKALYPIRGKPMIAHVIDKAARVADEVVVAVRDRERALLYERELGVRSVLDDSRLSGPLAGVLGALRSSVCDKALVLPNDMPYLEHALLDHLVASLEDYDVSSPVLPNGLVATTVVAARCSVALWVLEELTKFPGRSRVADLHRGAPRVALLNAKRRGVHPIALLSINRRESLEKTVAEYPEGPLDSDVFIERSFTLDDARIGAPSTAGSLWGTLLRGLYLDEFKVYAERGAFMLAAYALLDSPSSQARELGRLIVSSLKEVS
ncbi:MAG: NTP transferase domain-containing protein [Acidilobaceae archaeon]